MKFNRTNDISEGWKYRFRYLVRYPNPNILVFIETIQLSKIKSSLNIFKFNETDQLLNLHFLEITDNDSYCMIILIQIKF